MIFIHWLNIRRNTQEKALELVRIKVVIRYIMKCLLRTHKGLTSGHIGTLENLRQCIFLQCEVDFLIVDDNGTNNQKKCTGDF